MGGYGVRVCGGRGEAGVIDEDVVVFVEVCVGKGFAFMEIFCEVVIAVVVDGDVRVV